MIQKIKTYLLMAMMALIPAIPILVPVTVHAADTGLQSCNNIASGIQAGVKAAANGPNGAPATSCSDDGLGSKGGIGGLASTIVNIFSIVVGAVSVIMIIFGGFRYITSGGDSGRVGGAKNTLVYAIIGLVIVALAQVIVHFVLAQSNNAGGTG